jgi:hypothetical protein
MKETLEFDDVELDNTGKRERSRREPPKRTNKVSMYQSAAEVLVKNPSINDEALAVKAVLALASVKTCRVAWRDILAVLDAAGCLNARGQRLR